MVKACDLKKGAMVDIGGMPHIAEHIVVQTPSARGGATLYKVRFRNVQTKDKVDQTLKGDDSFKEADFEARPAQYLYETDGVHAFMDLTDYSQFEWAAADLEDVLPYLVENMEGLQVLMSDGRVLGVRLPDVVEMEIASCDPSMKGASATSRTKPATMATGLVVQVPEYIAPGERIRIDTRTNHFVSRA